MSAAELFGTTFGRPPDAVYSAPGRVNLIGEHTDYSGGLVLPFAIDARAVLAAGRLPGPTVRVVSAQRPGPIVEVQFPDLRPDLPDTRGWAGYVCGAIWALREQGVDVAGVELALDSQVPSGAGLSSSAAVECVTTLAVADLAGVALPALEIARLAQRAENDYVGVPCGPMDQTASAAAEAGSVLLFDTKAGTVEHIPFDPAAHGMAVLVIDTRVAHSLADGEYARRREACEQAASTLGVRWLRDLAERDLPELLERLPNAELRRRLRHVVTENGRVAATVALLRAGRVAAIGPLLSASHASLRDDYEVSCAELDQAVESAMAAGADGARMTGGGFGGSVIALIPTAAVPTVIDRVTTDFAAREFAAPIARLVAPAAGARRDSAAPGWRSYT